MKERVGQRVEIGGQPQSEKGEADGNDKDKQRAGREQMTVKWIVTASARYRDLIDRGEKDAAEQDWKDIKPLLEKWRSKGITGTQEVFNDCEAVLGIPAGA